MADLKSKLTVVLHQIRSPDNLGSIARIMVNFGLPNLTLSDPATYAFAAAQKLAVGAEPLLDHLRLFPTLADALGQAVFACGTTSRRVRGRRVLTPEEGVHRLAASSKRGQVALVFGGEKRGLSDGELSLCQEVIAIPTESSQRSMNLAQAVAVLLYLCSRENETVVEQSPRKAGAKLMTVHQLEELMEEVLLHSGFLHPQSPKRSLRELLQPLLRGELAQREAEMWLASFRQLRRTLGLKPPSR